MAVREPQVTLVRICDPAGRPRGTGFVADHLGTVVTSHEAVDGLTRVVLQAPGERTRVAEADAITALPEADLALIRAEGLAVRPVPISLRDRVESGTYVQVAAGGWRHARVLGPRPVTYTTTDRTHAVPCAVELALGTAGSDALRLGGAAPGGPVLDAGTGAVLAVIGTAPQERELAAFAVPLRAAAAPDGPLAALLRRNAATVPGYGRDLNPAGALRLMTATTPAGPPEVPGGDVSGRSPQGVERRVAAKTNPAERSAPEETPRHGTDPSAAPVGQDVGVQDRSRGPHLLGEAWLRAGDAPGHLAALRMLADAITRRSVQASGPQRLGGIGEFGPWFWERIPVPEAERIDLLRRLLPADGPPGGAAPAQGRYLDAVDRRLAAAPRVVQPLLCHWFDDDRPLPAAPDAAVRPTIAGVAQALLHARRRTAVDDLTEALVERPHPRAHELLTALAEDEPSALCRAAARWARDARPDRWAAAASYGPAAAPYAATTTDRELLTQAALSLLARPGGDTLRGPALGLLVRDPHTRPRHLAAALAAFAGDGPHRPPATALAAALDTDPQPVLAAFRDRLARPAEDADDILRALAATTTATTATTSTTPATTPAAHQIAAAALIAAYARDHPDAAPHTAAYVDRRLEHGPDARACLLPLVRALLQEGPAHLRRALAPVLAAPGSRASRALRAELLDVLLDCEHRQPYGAQDLAVLDALLRAAALGAGRRAEARTRDLVHRTGTLLVRTPEGAARFDRRLVGLAHEAPEFAALLAGWLAAAPQEWAAVMGPGARRTVESLGTPMPMRAAPRGHGSLRPA
ncbi:hypothetical protein [Streptomyces hypolithicus]